MGEHEDAIKLAAAPLVNFLLLISLDLRASVLPS